MGPSGVSAVVVGLLSMSTVVVGQTLVDVGGDATEWEYRVPDFPVVLNASGGLVWARQLPASPIPLDYLMTDTAGSVGSPTLLIESGDPVGNQSGEEWVSLRRPLVTDDAARAWLDGTSSSYVGVGRVELDGSPNELIPVATFDYLVAAQLNYALYFKSDGSLTRLNSDDTSVVLVGATSSEWPDSATGAINEAGEAVAVVYHVADPGYLTLRYFPTSLSGIEDLFDARGPLPGMSGKELGTLRWPTLDDTDDDYPVIAFEGQVRNTSNDSIAHKFSIWANTGDDFEFRCLMKSGDTAPGFPSGSAFDDPLELGIDRLGLSLNRGGQIAFAASVENNSAPIGSGVFVIDVSGGSVTCRVASGEPAAGLPNGYEWTGFTRSWILDNGDVVFEAQAASASAGLAVNGLWVTDSDGESAAVVLYGGEGGDPFILGAHGCFRPQQMKHIWEQGGRADGRRRAFTEDGHTIVRAELNAGPVFSFVTTEAVILGEPHEPENALTDVTCDFNCDGNVDQDDVAALTSVVGGGPSPCCKDPDINADGNVDGDDVTELATRIAGSGC